MDPQEEFSKVAQKIAANEGIENVSLEFQYSGEKGSGFQGCIKAITLRGSNDRSLDVIFKHSGTDPDLRREMLTRRAFLQEIKFYEEVVPSLQKLQEEYQIKEPFDNIPRCYFTNTEPLKELLVLENLATSNYGTFEEKLMNSNHLKLCLRTFAKFQASTLALKILKPEQFEKIKAILVEDLKSDVYFNLTNRLEFATLAKELLRIFDPVTENHYYEKCRKFVESFDEHFRSLFDQAEEVEVFSQADSWFGNIMFQYKDEEDRSEPTNMKIIDFQFAYPRSPTMDLAYLFYGTGTSKEELDNWKINLRYFHKAVGEHLAKFNLDVENVLPFDKLLKLWSKYSKFGLIGAIPSRKCWLAEKSEFPDMVKLAKEGRIGDTFNFEIKNEKEFHRQLKELAIHFIDNDFI